MRARFDGVVVIHLRVASPRDPAERALSVVAILARRPVTLPALARRLGVSERTAWRDLRRVRRYFTVVFDRRGYSLRVQMGAPR